ncbi:MAG: PLP-dependent aminotransferase family protein [Bacilli bacterium]|nr:PLP-dependent aminotransferase family protein [Bacilli bacterium]
MPKVNNVLYQILYTEIKNKIFNNELKKSDKLESVRSLAKKKNISTTTVEKAYNQLLVEGYISSIPRSGYVVNEINNHFNMNNNSSIEQITQPLYTNNSLTTDLFDIKNYKTIINKVVNYDFQKLYTSCDERGELELREEIRKYILLEREVKCDVNQIVVGSGTQYLLNILLDIAQKRSVSFLNPEFKKAMSVFRTHKYVLKPEKSIQDILNSKTDFLYISPSNTYPTGEVIKVKERNELIKWASTNHTYIIEDDYNFFIRYNSYTVPSIHSFDNGKNVIYMGSFSKIILPSIRISFMVLPEPLYNIYKDTYQVYSQGVSKLEQLSLALFMKEGYFKRHTKKLYSLYKEKNEVIKETLNTINNAHRFAIRGNDSNLHIIIDFYDQTLFQSFIGNCQKKSYKYDVIDDSLSIIFPYSGFNTSDIKTIIPSLFQ